MALRNILITGGAGFVGSHVGKELVKNGYQVRALDLLVPQVHGLKNKRPAHLDPNIELVIGDVRDSKTLDQALEGVDAVIHLAAAVGVGQSMYQVAEYTSHNNFGTAVLLEALIKNPVERLIVASSVTIYGEGLYKNAKGNLIEAAPRPQKQLVLHQWEVMNNTEPLVPLPTPETKNPHCASVYALSKYDQERMCLLIGKAYDIPTVALRIFNAYGPHQALSNPYTGVLAIFASRLLNDHAPLVYEDGQQRRDFVSVYDVARAFRLALEKQEVVGEAINIGSGSSHTVYDIATELSTMLGKRIEPEVSGTYRAGDIRHCFADISKARSRLKYEPEVSFKDGLVDLIDWLKNISAGDNAEAANAELLKRGLIK